MIGKGPGDVAFGRGERPRGITDGEEHRCHLPFNGSRELEREDEGYLLSRGEIAELHHEATAGRRPHPIAVQRRHAHTGRRTNGDDHVARNHFERFADFTRKDVRDLDGGFDVIEMPAAGR